VIIQYSLNQFINPLGGTTAALGTITGDSYFNLSIQPISSVSIVGNTQISGSLSASTMTTTSMNTSSIFNTSSINGIAFGAQAVGVQTLAF
jgi:hypothetical protein